MEIEPQKLYSATILQWSYLLLGFLAILWNYIGVFRAFLQFFTERSTELQKILLGHNFIDTYFLVFGILCLLTSWGLTSYSRQTLSLAFFANLAIVVITVAAVVVPLLALYFNSKVIDRSTLVLLLMFFYLPIFLPIFAFAVTGFY